MVKNKILLQKIVRFKSFVKVVVFLGSTDHCFVGLIEILLGDHVTIFSHSFHTSLLTDTGDISCTDLIGSANVLFQVHIFSHVHFAGHCSKDKSLLSSIREWELNFSIESAWTQQGGI